MVSAPVAPAVGDQQDAFVQSRQRLVAALDETGSILHDLRQFNRQEWVVRYPAGESESSPLSVLRLELKLGASCEGSSLVDALEKNSVSQLLDERMARSVSHLDNLRVRLCDTQSKVLVTGDLNAGKSTFTNALMRRNLVPTDQQPCTTVFCEIHDAGRENNGKEEVHIVYDSVHYDVANPATYTRRGLDEIEAVFAEEEGKDSGDAPVLKCYCSDIDEAGESLLHNGAVDIALIDGPGLNRNRVQTTALFAREEQIDVVVFVVNAENHFTLSACEFLQKASNDKAYVFVVVNKYEQIQNKEKCRTRVLEQLRDLSPRTYEDAADLVHFVDARAMCRGADDATTEAQRFHALERNLRDFVLRRRVKSKLMPAQTFLERVLNDVLFLTKLNLHEARAELGSAHDALETARPALAECEANAQKAQRAVESEEDRIVTRITAATEAKVAAALDKVGAGASAHASVALPAYPGLFRLWDYAQDVRGAMLASLSAAICDCEASVRELTTAAVADVASAGDTYLPADVSLPKRVFVPEAMFARKPTHLAGLGVSTEIVSVRVSDLFDMRYHIAFATGAHKASQGEDEHALMPAMSLGLAALTLVGSHSFGVKTAIDACLRIVDVLGSRSARRWAGPMLLLASAGALAWLVVDLPSAIPRNIGRHLRRELVSGRAMRAAGNSTALLRSSSNVFSTMHATRITRETRKVLRLAGWDLQEKFRIAIAQRRSDVAHAEEQAKVATFALQWFAVTAAKSAQLTSDVRAAIDVATV